MKLYLNKILIVVAGVSLNKRTKIGIYILHHSFYASLHQEEA